MLDLRHGIEYPDWFAGATINIVDSCLLRWREKAPERIAVSHEDEAGRIRELTFGDMEAYVAEDVARKMLAADPALKKQFEEKLASDPKFAADPRARLDFFYSRHSAFDRKWNLYPVRRTDVEPPR